MKHSKGLVIAGLSGGSGKSVVSVGITAALAKRADRVVPFKKGPDYIDAGWLQLAAGQRCYNLDPYLMSKQSLLSSYAKHSDGADMVVVEGNRGLYDGVNAQGGYSTAELALTLDLPVLLVVDCTKTTRTVAAMVLGCQKFDSRIRICGVVLNQIATERQRALVTQTVEHYTSLPVIGAVPRLKKDIFPMRHLGMVPHQEYAGSREAVDYLAGIVEENVDLVQLEKIMAPVRVAPSDTQEPSPVSSKIGEKRVKIGVLQDAAFQFYYSENLEALESNGAELVYINAMKDKELPEIDGLYIGGGFPETGACRLALNKSFRASVKKAAESGLPIYAECGGLIYLGESLVLDGEEFPLTGVFPIRFGMSAKPQAHGYSIFNVEKKNGFYPQGLEVKGHEFRYSTVLHWGGSDTDLAVKMTRGKGFINGRDGLVRNNVFALYTHVHAEGTPQWAVNFVDLCCTAQRGRSGR
ncbi:cobyrinate a,c-diamide synthase [Desulforhopalus singaporensis]|uniref:Cobyrinate a,c-diamide synthase n=1 Tax=Desulforhopalus singaporensis TaxID=91360 RepID=A0A1H0MR09_9BACT|nr:cobyrinate a,c-diamide synthase [Desulforhopalus singaporensis]SDO82736.1 hydrogenobyrinic acid a,c-diamide synthase (glutamine-hydrolysing) /cobyrinate a,c-diamide synthase [Desulforhopalus singaporensis]